MILEAKKSNTNLMVGHTYRFYPSSMKVKELLDSRKIGSVRLVLDYAVDPGQILGKPKTPKWLFSKEKGGGIFFDAIHSVDKLRFWLGSEISSVYVPLIDTIENSYSTERMALAILNFSNGVSVCLMPVAQVAKIRDTGTKIIGTKGILQVTYGEEVKIGKKDWTYYKFDHKAEQATYAHNLQGFINEISEFISSIKNKRPPLVTGEEGKKNLEVVLSMYESYKKKVIVNI